MPIYLLFILWATAAVVPLPKKKSITMSFSTVMDFIKNATTLSGFEKENSSPICLMCVLASSLEPTPMALDKYCSSKYFSGAIYTPSFLWKRIENLFVLHKK